MRHYPEVPQVGSCPTCGATGGQRQQLGRQDNRPGELAEFADAALALILATAAAVVVVVAWLTYAPTEWRLVGWRGSFRR